MSISGGEYLITTVVALFAVMGILALPPVFLAATAGLSPEARRKVAFQTTLAVAVTLVVSFFVGTYILELFKIEMDAFKVYDGSDNVTIQRAAKAIRTNMINRLKVILFEDVSFSQVGAFTTVSEKIKEWEDDDVA